MERQRVGVGGRERERERERDKGVEEWGGGRQIKKNQTDQ